MAVTRARTQVILFSSFDPADIDLTRTNALGTQHLRAYLELAAGGLSRSGDVSNRQDRGRDRLAEEIAARLRERGHEVQLQFGLSRFTVDLAVRTPGSPRWQVAVLLDGPAWRQRSTVADRDAAPQLLDQVMNWPAVARIWLPQWINDLDTVLNGTDTLVAATTELDQEPQPPAGAEPQDSTVHDESPIAVDVDTEPTCTAGPALPTHNMPIATAAVPHSPGISEESEFVPYQPTELGKPADLDMLSRDHRVQDLVRNALLEVIESDGPIEIDRLIGLVHKCFGINKVHKDRGRLMAGLIRRGIERTPFLETEFLWPSHLHPDAWRGFRRSQGSTERDFKEIAPQEIANAVRGARQAGQAYDHEELYRSTTRLLGYGRMTESIRTRIAEVVTWASTTDRRTH